MPTNSLIENYILEIISRARATQGQCDYLCTFSYANDIPKNLAKTISKICDYLCLAVIEISKQADADVSDDPINNEDTILLQQTDYLIQKLSAHLRFVHGARVEMLPWSIIPSFQLLVNKLLPDVQILLRPQWKYNYAVNLADLLEGYKYSLAEYEDYLPHISIESSVLDLIGSPLHLVSFPALERKNILLHSLLGHEVGHLLARKFATKERKDSFATSVRTELLGVVRHRIQDSPIPQDDLFTPTLEESELTHTLDQAVACWERAIIELLSDMVGVLLFGPAAAFASLEIALRTDLDTMPSRNNYYYPPWRTRLRQIVLAMEKYGGGFFPLPEAKFRADHAAHINRRYELIKNISSKISDQESINKHEILQIVYKNIDADLEEGIKFIINDCQLKDHMTSATTLYEHLPELMSRLDAGIPPNSVKEITKEKRPASMIEIINAASFHKLTWDSPLLNKDNIFNEDIYKKRNRMNNLTMKAIEYAYIQNAYDNRIPG